MGQHLGPLIGVGHGSGHHAEAPGVLVGANPELPVAMIDVVLVLFLARQDYLEGAFRRVGRQIAHLGGQRAAGDGEEILAIARPANTQAIQFVFLLVDHLVVVAAGDMAHQLVRPLGGILGDIEERRVVGGPGEAGDVALAILDAGKMWAHHLYAGRGSSSSVEVLTGRDCWWSNFGCLPCLCSPINLSMR